MFLCFFFKYPFPQKISDFLDLFKKSKPTKNEAKTMNLLIILTIWTVTKYSHNKHSFILEDIFCTFQALSNCFDYF